MPDRSPTADERQRMIERIAQIVAARALRILAERKAKPINANPQKGAA